MTRSQCLDEVFGNGVDVVHGHDAVCVDAELVVELVHLSINA